jgi:sec-independent protein translocase protein TatB
MFDIGPEKVLVILVVVFIFLGPKELPAAARKIGELFRQLRSLQDTLRTEVNSALSTESDDTEPRKIANEPQRPDDGASFI